MVLVLVVGATACGAGNKSQKAVATAFTAVQSAGDSFTAWDAERQLEIVDEAESREAAEAALADHRRRQAVVLEAFAYAYSAIGAAAAATVLLAEGEKFDGDVDALIAEALRAVLAVKAAIDAMRGP